MGALTPIRAYLAVIALRGEKLSIVLTSTFDGMRKSRGKLVRLVEV